MRVLGTHIWRFKTFANQEQNSNHAANLMPQKSSTSEFNHPKLITIIPAGKWKTCSDTQKLENSKLIYLYFCRADSIMQFFLIKDSITTQNSVFQTGSEIFPLWNTKGETTIISFRYAS
jgi:hypothetical protein